MDYNNPITLITLCCSCLHCPLHSKRWSAPATLFCSRYAGLQQLPFCHSVGGVLSVPFHFIRNSNLLLKRNSHTFHFASTSLQVSYSGLPGQRFIALLLLSDDMLRMYTAGQLTMGQSIRIFHIANTYNLPVERRNTTCIQITYFGSPRAAEYI